MELTDSEASVLKDALKLHLPVLRNLMRPSHVRNGYIDALQTLTKKCGEAFNIDTAYIQREISGSPRDFFLDCDCAECQRLKNEFVSRDKREW